VKRLLRYLEGRRMFAVLMVLVAIAVRTVLPYLPGRRD